MLNWLRNHISFDNPLRRAWHLTRGVAAALVYGFPARRLICVGITGTNGKTTTTHLLEHILRNAGKRVAMASTVAFSVNGKIEPNHSKMTTLQSFKLQKFLKQCVARGVEIALIECTSQALHQHRLFGIPFQIGVLTNITHEHLNYHGTMEKYKDAKKLLFRGVKTAALNMADQYFKDFTKLPVPQKITYGFDQGDLQAKNPNYSKFGTTATFSYAGQKATVELKIPGDFNVENALAATGAALACGMPLSQITQAINTFKGVEGRMERIASPKGFEVIVDFGLTPDALQKLYNSIRNTMPISQAGARGRIIGIIGSCGSRDQSKRPHLGRIVARHADLTIVTDEEPYDEDPRKIMNEVMSGALQTGKRKGIEIELIEDRYEAIEYAVAHAEPSDTIVVTGMGPFQTRQMNEGPIPWDERQVVREIIAKYAI